MLFGNEDVTHLLPFRTAAVVIMDEFRKVPEIRLEVVAVIPVGGNGKCTPVIPVITENQFTDCRFRTGKVTIQLSMSFS